MREKRPRTTKSDDRNAKSDGKSNFTRKPNSSSNFGNSTSGEGFNANKKPSFSKEFKPRYNNSEWIDKGASNSEKPKFGDRRNDGGGDKKEGFNREYKPRFNSSDSREGSRDNNKFGDRRNDSGGDKNDGFNREYKPRFNNSDSREGSRDNNKFGDRRNDSGGDKNDGFNREYKPRFNNSDSREGSRDNNKFGDRRNDSGGDKKEGFNREYKPRFNNSDSREGSRDNNKFGDRRNDSGGDKKEGFNREYKPRFNNSDSREGSRDNNKFGDRRNDSGGDRKFNRSVKPSTSKSFGNFFNDENSKAGSDKGGFNKPKFSGDSPRRTSTSKPFNKPFSSDDKPKSFVPSKFAGRKDNDDSEKFDDNFDYDNYSETPKTDDFKRKPKEFSSSPYKRSPYKTIKKPVDNVLSKEHDDGLLRLNKYISNAGVCSRREADELIETGVITVNGKIVTELGTRISPTDIVLMEGQKISQERKVYILVNKPKDFITTVEDPHERKTVMNLVKDACRERVYPVGRLDRNTTGVLLLTNDGELTKKLTHPKYEKPKMYHVFLDKPLSKADFEQIEQGVELEDGFVKVDAIDYVAKAQNFDEVGVELHSGRNRIVRRIFEGLGYRVVKLDRVMFAGLTKKDLARGRWRFLTAAEVSMLYAG